MTIDMSQFLQTFYEESFEGLEVMESGLLNLDIGAADVEEVNTIFRAAHSIKGGSGTFGLGDVASFTHLMETLLDELRDGRRDVSQGVVDLLLQSVDCLREMLSTSQEEEPLDQERISDLKQRLEQMLGGGTAQTSEAAVQPTVAVETGGQGWRIVFKPHPHLFQTGNDPLRILRELEDMGEYKVKADVSALPPFGEMSPEECYLDWEIELTGDVTKDDIDEVFAWVEDDCDLEVTPLVVEQPAAPAKAEETAPKQRAEEGLSGELVRERRSGDRRKGDRRTKDGGSIRVDIEKVDAVINLVGELVITQSMLSTLGESFEMSMIQNLRDGLAQLEQNTRELQEDVMRMRMLPISFVFNRFPRLVHDLSNQLGKQVQLEMSGENTEVDKTVTEKLTDPLVHLVRNSMDHGIEPSVEERIAAGKPEIGTVWLNAFHQGGNIVIEVKDDGRGLNADRIFSIAVKRGLVSPDVSLPPEQIYELIFLPGFSTVDVVSDVSGRGVGMDVVRRNIQSLGGSVEITSEPGKGSCFTVRLPLTLAILDGQSVSVGGQNYIVPLVSIVESIQIKDSMVSQIAGEGETFRLRGAYIPVIRLSDVFGIEAKVKKLSEGLLVIVEGDGKQMGLFVDELLGQQQVVIKSMEVNYKRVEGISGATILGDGTVALILDISGLVKLSRGTPTQSPKRGGPVAA
jgi:two-component system chemotaxis sensor kinase CheA